MVGPIDDAQRRLSMFVIGIGFTLLIAVSAGSMALLAAADPVAIALVTAGGLLVGGVLMWYLRYIVRSGTRHQRR